MKKITTLSIIADEMESGVVHARLANVAVELTDRQIESTLSQHNLEETDLFSEETSVEEHYLAAEAYYEVYQVIRSLGQSHDAAKHVLKQFKSAGIVFTLKS